ncbi:DEAD/DEAH box helicase [Roseimaritima ulvae]|uniref:UvrABC system protein B n=1 Tax=Roseimaritima ulvae TaxID=980254 RepID=A0A5B9QX65_9BACT|nr:DEAD/DEAH box helicase [Roseimaritima ulvae]QEG41955.1 UvrABC system protein B [Roseimaritima ulvae]
MTPPTPRIEFHEGTLRLRGFDKRLLRQTLQGLTVKWDDRDDCFRCDALHSAEIRERLKRELPGPVDWDFSPDQDLRLVRRQPIQLRPDQLSAVEAFEQEGRRGLVVMPTGTGKTVVAIELILRAGTSTLIVVPVRDLMYQWHAKLLAATGVDCGLIGDGVHRVTPLSVTTYDSAAIHMPRIGGRFQMIVFDEVHHLAGAWRSDAAQMSAAAIRLGLTATLPGDRQRLQRLVELVGPVCYQQSIAEASGRSLAEYTVKRIAVPMNEQENQRYRALSHQVQRFVYEQRQRDEQFRWDDVYKLVGDTEHEPQLAAEAMLALRAFRGKSQIEERASGKLRLLEDLLRLHAGEPVMVFVGSNVMAREISLRFLVPCLLSHCRKQERRDLLEGFAEGRYPVLVANRVLDEGVDLPAVKVAIVLGGMASSRQAIQRLGRVLRKTASGQSAILYEVVTDSTKEVQRSRRRRRNEAFQHPSGRGDA